MTAIQVWMIIGAVWLIGVPVWRFTVDRKPTYGEDESDRLMKALMWPLLLTLIAGLWFAIRGWPLLIVAGIVALLFAATTGLLPI